MKHIAIILARGGSKRLPRKNILELNGKPMLAWTVEAAIESGKYSKVLVSTDDPEIAKIGEMYGAEVPFLRSEAADDIAPSSAATLAALSQAEQYWNERYDVVSQLMANCPLRNSTDITSAYDNFCERDVSSQISCFRFGWMNPWWAVKLNQQLQPTYLFPDAITSRSQDLPDLYCPSGAIWIAKPSALRAAKTFYTEDCIFNAMDWMSAMDIDDANDLVMAQACFHMKKHN